MVLLEHFYFCLTYVLGIPLEFYLPKSPSCNCSERLTPASGEWASREEMVLFGTIYADYFNFPLKGEEFSRYAPFVRLEEAHLIRVLDKLVKEQHLETEEGYFVLPGRKSLVQKRITQQRNLNGLLVHADKILPKLRALAWIRGAYLTGSLAAKNPEKHDDLDVLLVVDRRRVFVTLYGIRLLKKLSILKDICPNFIVDENNLKLGYPNLFTAIELAHARSLKWTLKNKSFETENPWLSDLLPHFDYSVTSDDTITKAHVLGECLHFMFSPVLSMVDFVLFRWVRGRSKGRYAKNQGVFKPHSPHRQLRLFRFLLKKAEWAGIQHPQLLAHLKSQIAILEADARRWDEA